MTLKNSTIDDSGVYICVGTMNNSTNNVSTSVLVKGILAKFHQDLEEFIFDRLKI